MLTRRTVAEGGDVVRQQHIKLQHLCKCVTIVRILYYVVVRRVLYSAVLLCSKV